MTAATQVAEVDLAELAASNKATDMLCGTHQYGTSYLQKP